MQNDDLIYSLNIEDVQMVANQELDRDLSPNEIELIIDSICEKINWYDAIADSINEKFES
jgi:hypothetical protein